jgi:predicted histidine transporter YuiF (NhaC family)
MKNFIIWVHGLGAAFISAFVSSASGVIALPSVFNFSHDGMINMAKVSTVPALLAAFAYLKSSPLPAVSITQVETKTTTLDVTKQ